MGVLSQAYRIRRNGLEPIITVAAGAVTFGIAVEGTPQPATLSARPWRNKVTLSWDPVEGATSYQVSSDGSFYTDIGNVLSHVYSSLTNGVEYTFSVVAVTSAGESKPLAIQATPFEPKALFVVANSTALTTGEKLASDDLTAMGHTVVLRNASSTLPSFTGLHVLVLSDTGLGTDLAKYTNPPIPMFTFGFSKLENLNMATSQSGTELGRTEIEVTDNTHSATKGLTVGVNTVFSVSTNCSAIDTAVLMAGFKSLAFQTLYPTHSAVTAFEPGLTLINGATLKSRVLQSFFRDEAYPNLTALGKTVFTNGLDWLHERFITKVKGNL